jgi:hypothetical protein
MELKPFIKVALRDIIEAVEEVRNDPSSNRDMYLTTAGSNRTIEFDIAVTVEDSTAIGGHAGIKVFHVAEGGGELSKENRNSSVSRIMFGVHIDRSTKQENIEGSHGVTFHEPVQNQAR